MNIILYKLYYELYKDDSKFSIEIYILILSHVYTCTSHILYYVIYYYQAEFKKDIILIRCMGM